MKKLLFSIILIVSVFILVSCGMDDIQLSDNIASPENNNLPISGEWIIEDYVIRATSVMDEEMANSYLGMEGLFHKELVAIGDNYCLDPSYKIKNVDTDEYLIYQYKVNPEFLNIDKEEIQIVSIRNNDQFFNEFIKISEDKIIVNIDGVFFYLNKLSDEVDDEKIASYKYRENEMFSMVNISDEDVLKTGLLLGLKSLELENNIETWNYRTIFIRGYNKDVVSIYEMEDILLPRKTGFWKVKVDREEIDGNVNDTIVANAINKTKVLEDKEELEPSLQMSIKEVGKEEKKDIENTVKNILYIGNDYISIENVYYRNKGERVLEFYPIDNINKGNPMKIFDIIGKAGQEAFIEGANKKILSENQKYKDSLIDLKPNEESFGLFRRNGHWVFEGRLNFAENGIYRYKNFNIKAIPPKEVVHFDEISIPWNAIKTKIPEALDVFISPNEDLAIVLNHNNILIYLIEDGEIGDIPVEKIKLKAGEKIIMAEWATGRYPQLWEDAFLKN